MLADADSKLLFANVVAHRLLSFGGDVIVRNGRLHAANHSQDADLRRAIRNAALAAIGRSVTAGALLELRRLERKQLSLLICPLPPDLMRGARAEPCAAIFVSDFENHCPVPETVLANYYRLTPAEARLVTALVAGTRLQDYAEQAGISIETARNQLKMIFNKTGHHRQSELIRDVLENLLLRLAASRQRP
jgi:DNA-binding CsgD family transcriptional regulator